MSTHDTPQAEGRDETTPDWIVYQIGGPDRDTFRFIVTPGFQDEMVERELRDGEFMDTTANLPSVLGADVAVLQPVTDELLTALQELVKTETEQADSVLREIAFTNAHRAIAKALGKG